MKNIDSLQIGENYPVFIIAELSANHNGDFSIAKETIKAAQECGADAIKLQTYTPDTITIECQKEYFQINQGTIWDGTTLYKLYQEAYMPWEWQPELKEYAEKLGLICFSSPFDHTAVDFLEKMDVPAYKIASFEITDIPLIEYAASKGKPIILSTGVAALGDIEQAVSACKKQGNEQIVLLKCVSAYPAPYENMNLSTIPNLAETFQVAAGLSDHSIGASIPIAAVALGAKVIEKHFILDKKLGGPDASFSMEPEDFKAMATGIRNVEKALGNVSYEFTEEIKKSREFARSLFVADDIQQGEVFSEKNVRSIRPGHGAPPKYLNSVIGKKAKNSYKKGTPLSLEMIDW